MMIVYELMDWLRADESDVETVRSLLAAAIAHVENETGMVFSTAGTVTHSISGTWPLSLRGDPGDGDVTLERWSGSGWEVVPDTSYYVDGAFLRPAGPAHELGVATRYRVTYAAGYGDGTQPEPVQVAVKMLVQMWYDGMDSEDTWRAVRALLAPYRRVVV